MTRLFPPRTPALAISAKVRAQCTRRGAVAAARPSRAARDTSARAARDESSASRNEPHETRGAPSRAAQDKSRETRDASSRAVRGMSLKAEGSPPREARDKLRESDDPSRAPRDKLSRLEALLRRPEGATLAQSAAALGWVERSVRGAMAGGLKRRGLTVTSIKVDGVRTYRLPPVEAAQ